MVSHWTKVNTFRGTGYDDRPIVALGTCLDVLVSILERRTRNAHSTLDQSSLTHSGRACRLLGIAPLRQDGSVFGDVDRQETGGFAGACILADQMITTGGLEKRLTHLVDSRWPCCGILRTNTALQHVRKDATGVMVNAGFSARRVIDHFCCQSVAGHVWELDRGQLRDSLIVLQGESGAHAEEGAEHASEQWSLSI